MIYFVSVLVCLQLLNLLDVIIDSAGSKSSSSDKSLVSTSKPSLGPQISAVEADVNTGSGILSSVANASTTVDDSSKPTPSDNNMEYESQRVLSNLPQAELRLLCSLLAQEGYAYGPMLVDCFISLVFVFVNSFCLFIYDNWELLVLGGG